MRMAEELVCRVPFKEAIEALATAPAEAAEMLLIASRMESSADPTRPTGPLYWDGKAVRKGGGVAAVSAEVKIELMLPVTLAAAAADCTAIASPGRIRLGMYSKMIDCAIALNWASPVL